MKASPQAHDLSMPSGTQPAADANPPMAPDPHADDARQWAGDPYDEGDETQPDDPSVTAHFSDSQGEEAWLERDQDGTLTGWVRDATGQVYRYSDADAWAIDVDDAGMNPTGAAPDAGSAPDDAGSMPTSQAQPPLLQT